MIKQLFLLITLIVTMAWSLPSDTLEYRKHKRRKINYAYLDVQSGAQRVISSDRSRIHNYEAFSMSYVDTLADEEIKVFVALVNEGYELHFKYYLIWTEKSPLLFSFTENPDTISMSIDTVIAVNRNRSGNLNNILFSSHITVTDSVDTLAGGTVLESSFVGGGTGVGGSSLSGTSVNENEWIFGENQYVVFKLKNMSGDPSAVSVQLFWYEIKEQ